MTERRIFKTHTHMPAPGDSDINQRIDQHTEACNHPLGIRLLDAQQTHISLHRPFFGWKAKREII